MPVETAISIVIGLLTIGTTILVVGLKMGVLNVKVDTLWDHVFRRALSEGINKGVVAMNSPVRLTKRGEEMFQYTPELRKSLKEFHQKEGKDLSDSQFFIEIDKRFGEQILKETSTMFGIHYGACVLAAMQIAREE